MIQSKGYIPTYEPQSKSPNKFRRGNPTPNVTEIRLVLSY